MKIDLLEWDTRFFGKKTGSVNIDDAEINPANIVSAAKELEFELLYLFSKKPRPELETQGFALVDTKVTYGKTVSSAQSSIQLVNYTGEATQELISLALQSGWKSRFNTDKKLQHKYPELYTQWLTRSLSGEFADAVLVHYYENTIAGLVTSRIENNCKGKVGLFAVAEEYRGKGIGKGMLLALENWYHKKGIVQSEITTQQENTAACKLYESTGYMVKDTSYVYHLHL